MVTPVSTAPLSSGVNNKQKINLFTVNKFFSSFKMNLR